MPRIKTERPYSHFFSLDPGTILEKDENGGYVVKTGTIFTIPAHIVEDGDNDHIFKDFPVD